MKVMEAGEAGEQKNGDCLIKVREGKGKIMVKGAKNRRQIEELIVKRMEELGVEADVEAECRNADDFVILGRLDAALAIALREEVGGKKARRGVTSVDRIRRSIMVIPGNIPAEIKKLVRAGADCVLFDLQCHGEEKRHEARHMVRSALQNLDFGSSEIWVKINRDSAREDISAISFGNPHGICISGVENVDDIEVVERIMEEANLDSHLMPVIDSPRGIINSHSIAEASRKIVAVAFDGEHFLSLTGGRRSRDAFLFPRSKVLVSARNAGIQAIDGIYSEEGERRAFLEEAREVVELGFDGKFVMNMRQMKALHKIFAPNEKEVEEAKKIIDALGVTGYINGRIIDEAMERRARRILKLAEIYK